MLSMVFLIDRKGRLIETNLAMARFIGRGSAVELIAAVEREPGNQAFSQAKILKQFSILDSNGKLIGVELRFYKDPIWIKLNTRGLTGENGNLYIEGSLAPSNNALEYLQLQRDQLEREISERKRTEVELLASRERLQQLSEHQEAIREKDRKHIAMEIHDELGQLLTALKMDIALLRTHLQPVAAATQRVDEMRELIEKTIQIVRNVTSHLRPTALNYGLESALEWLAADFQRHTKIPCCFNVQGSEPQLSEPRATALFRIVQESLTNIARHANASRVDLTLANVDGEIELIIQDNGRGFDVAAARAGYSYGLQGIAERARLVKAQLDIVSEEGRGSVIHLCIPDESSIPATSVDADNS